MSSVIPDSNVTTQDGALGLATPTGKKTQAKIGTCALGTVGTVYQFSDVKTLAATLGEGPLTQAAAVALAEPGAGPVICVPATKAIAGANGSVTHVGTGTSVMTAGGSPTDAYDVLVKIVTAGANLAAAAAQFKYSLDGGRTFSAILGVPASGTYVVPGGGPQVGGAAVSGAAPFNIDPGQTLVIAVDGGGNQTFTFTGTQGFKTGSGGTFAALNATTLQIKVDGGHTQTVTFTGSETDATTTAAKINASTLGLSAIVTGGQVKLISDSYGTGSSINIISANAAAGFAATGLGTAGTGDAVKLSATTAAEVVAKLGTLTGAVATAAAGVVTITSTGSSTPSVQVQGSSTAACGFDNTLHSGTPGSTKFIWADGTFVAGDTYAFKCTAPMWDSTALGVAMTTLLADSREWFIVHAVGIPADTATARTNADTLKTQLDLASNAFRFSGGIVECPQDTDANLKASFATFASTRVLVAAGLPPTKDPIAFRQMARSSAWAATARAGAVPPSEDLARYQSGPLASVVALDRDEQVTPGLDAARFLTLRTFIGTQGFFVTNPNVMAPAGSDFGLLQYRRVMDIACASARTESLKKLNASLRVNANNTILEQEAKALEANMNNALAIALLQPNDNDGPGYISKVSATVDRTNNVVSTKTLNILVRITPKGYPKDIEIDIGFSNPAQA